MILTLESRIFLCLKIWSFYCSNFDLKMEWSITLWIFYVILCWEGNYNYFYFFCYQIQQNTDILLLFFYVLMYMKKRIYEYIVLLRDMYNPSRKQYKKKQAMYYRMGILLFKSFGLRWQPDIDRVIVSQVTWFKKSSQ